MGDTSIFGGIFLIVLGTIFAFYNIIVGVIITLLGLVLIMARYFENRTRNHALSRKKR